MSSPLPHNRSAIESSAIEHLAEGHPLTTDERSVILTYIRYLERRLSNYTSPNLIPSRFTSPGSSIDTRKDS